MIIIVLWKLCLGVTGSGKWDGSDSTVAMCTGTERNCQQTKNRNFVKISSIYGLVSVTIQGYIDFTSMSLIDIFEHDANYKKTNAECNKPIELMSTRELQETEKQLLEKSDNNSIIGNFFFTGKSESVQFGP
ncbi:hypothetical protein PoB_002335600 [Plakobranchus ocellatus]|uniref:Uncharacterized protein n=1 Tax=Plakobranchus ocellatus TaxID=259542 RepID=A0AAV3ZQR4_9GAST|nr:hypothetical protein PoB_002335600 [Plakobranchus ocellatus]